MSKKICFIAAPLIARSGVYNSTIELVEAAREHGLNWNAVVGVSARAGGSTTSVHGVREIEIEPSGPSGIFNLSRKLLTFSEVQDADLLISMIPQSDMALSLTKRRWVAYLRGLPWPAAGESSRVRSATWRTLERLALSRADQVWATTPTLANQLGGTVHHIVPPGLKFPSHPEPDHHGSEIVWAARYSADKNPGLFFNAMPPLAVRGVMFGSGPMEAELRAAAPTNVRIAGWMPRSEIWDTARVYVGTSSREAFGRSAVEAAARGIPVVISTEFGCAEMLYTDLALRERLVLPLDDASAWSETIQLLASDDEFWVSASNHVRNNANRLNIESAVSNVDAAAKAVLQTA